MITYSTNWMGPVNMKWYSDRGLTRKVSKVLEEDKAFYPKGLGAGDTWTYDEITTDYACGRIDIRGLDEEENYNGWSEYGLPVMHGEDWNALSEWLEDLTTDTLLLYNDLIEQFEQYYGNKIRWAK